MFTDVRERGREGKGQTDRHQCEREVLIGCLWYTTWLGLNPQPRYVPWLGIEPTIFWYMVGASTHCATWPGLRLVVLTIIMLLSAHVQCISTYIISCEFLTELNRKTCSYYLYFVNSLKNSQESITYPKVEDLWAPRMFYLLRLNPL